MIVTGAASGIGLGIAQAFHRAGASVVLGDVRQDALDQVQGTFPDQARLAFVQVDVRDEASVANLIAATEQAFGPPSVMIANAGIVPNASVLNMDLSAWDAAIGTNLTGVFLSCQAAARSMVAHGVKGRIVTMSSIARNVGRLGASAYCASKAGVEMFTKVLAMELLPTGRSPSTAIAPGVIQVRRPAGPENQAFANEAFGPPSCRRSPQGGGGNRMRCAQAVLFLARRARSTSRARSCRWMAG